MRCGQLVPILECSGVAKPECAAQVHNSQARVEQLRRHFHGGLVWRRQERQSGAAFRNRLDGKGSARRLAPSAELRKKFCKAIHRFGALTQIERWLADFWVSKQESRQLESSVAGCSNNGHPRGAIHRSIAPNRCCTTLLAARDGVITKTVSSPAIVPAT